ncbi:8-amino-7-oxononanoate synthase [Capnocytophaga stomatis]|uniref:aminotransferase class I/II-fold pyridoxal phosphate-dependent enzyme n=1 Tax=Capnocytophaga stomatis TaxID=1848904 RepID=UPI00194DEAB7|nr:8-amino-7-oxononanoate synthase [Capnocytophaga stomatis]GIJ93902.1 8-amino-7-oxononanoate synthase [Capnocytophaga stomatis]
MNRIPKHIIRKLAERKEKNAFRMLKINQFQVDFCSNDYIGFSKSEEIKIEVERILSTTDFQHGATGSRLISGNFPLFEMAENEIKKFHNSASALLFNSGYDANVGFFSCVPQRGDVVLYDNYIHASIRDGISMSLAKSYKFRHNDLEDLKKMLERFSNGENSVFVVTESVFSMDGDSPDLLKMNELVKKHNAFLIVDEAHALGVFGSQGCGLVQHLGLENDIFARIVTYGKALGCHGASVLGSQILRDYLINFARSFIYTTAMSPHNVATILAGYRQLQTTKSIGLLHQNITFFKRKIKEFHEKTSEKYPFISSDSAIQAVILSGNDFVKRIAQNIQKEGFGVIPILSPTVPKGQERLRICLHSFNTEEEISNFFDVFYNQFLTQNI